jgi:hypothetical protein
MSLQGALLMESSATDVTGAFSTPVTSNLLTGGHVTPDAQRAFYDGTVQSREPHAGIAYIDQAVGGVSSPRGDTRAAGYGFRSRAQKTQPFNGDYIGGTTVQAGRLQGEVGLNQTNTAQRIRSAGSTNVPDRGDTRAAFMSPTLIAALGKVRG